MQIASNTTRLLAILLGAALLCTLSLAAVSARPAQAANAVATTIKAPEVKTSISARCRSRAVKATSGRKASTHTAARRLRHARSVRQRRCSKRLRRAAARPHGRQTPKASQSIATPQIGPLVMGVDGGYGGWNATEVEMRVALNAAVTRHEWDPAEPVDAQDSLVYEAASQVHTRIHALLGANELGDPNHYREWVVEFIRRYGIGGSFWRENPGLDSARYAITTFELGNEPYFGGMTPTAYANTIRPTLDEVAQLRLPAKIILPSRVYGNDTSWMDALYRTIPNLNDLFYGFADHPYWYGHDPAQVSAAGPFARIATLRNRMNELGAEAKPIFISEYGESTANCGGECVDEETQAKHLAEMIEAVTAHTEWGVEMLSVFQLVDRGTSSGDRELQFGLLRQNGTPKPCYSIVDAAMQKYRG